MTVPTRNCVGALSKKAFLRGIYEEWYCFIEQGPPEDTRPMLEIGSGAGFLSEIIPEAITSELFYLTHVRVVADARLLPLVTVARE